MVQDPEKQWVELVVMPGAPQSVYDSMEVGLTVTDLERSRAFYRDFVGLEELPAVQDALLGVTKYPFRHGTTTVNVWSFGPTARANTRTAGIQYVISDVEAVDAKAKAQSVKIDTPLGNFSAGLRTIWLSDPDGITNYFAQIMRPRSPRSRGRLQIRSRGRLQAALVRARRRPVGRGAAGARRALDLIAAYDAGVLLPAGAPGDLRPAQLAGELG